MEEVARIQLLIDPSLQRSLPPCVRVLVCACRIIHTRTNALTTLLSRNLHCSKLWCGLWFVGCVGRRDRRTPHARGVSIKVINDATSLTSFMETVDKFDLSRTVKHGALTSF